MSLAISRPEVVSQSRGAVLEPTPPASDPLASGHIDRTLLEMSCLENQQNK